MTIHASYERHPDLGCEAVVFIDDESMGCFQIQRDLVVDAEAGGRESSGGGSSGREGYCVTTGASAPIYGGVVEWRRVDDDRIEFALTPKAGRLFGDNVLSFQITPVGDESVDEIIEHVERLLR
ncbi:hypothetical protein [Gordonia sputi]